MQLEKNTLFGDKKSKIRAFQLKYFVKLGQKMVFSKHDNLTVQKVLRPVPQQKYTCELCVSMATMLWKLMEISHKLSFSIRTKLALFS